MFSCGTPKACVRIKDCVQLHLFLTSAIHEDGCLASGPGRFTPRGKCHWYSLSKMLGGRTEPVSRLQSKENFIAPWDTN